MDTNEKIRRATKADYKGIMAIIPNGENDDDDDYIPDNFDMLMDNPLFDAFVYVVNDIIIGFGAIFIIDDNKTGVFRGGRVRKDYRKRRILVKIHSEVLRHYPMIKYLVSSTTIKPTDHFDLIRQGSVKLIATRKCTFFSGSVDHISTISRTTNISHSTVLQETNMRQMFRESKLFPNVFQCERLIIDSVPYRIMESNVPVILTEKTRAVVTSFYNKDQTFLTFGSYRRQPSGELYCKVDIYGSVGEYLKIHILRHFEMAIEIVKDFTDVCIFELRSSVNNVLIGNVMKEIGLTIPETSTHTEFMCIEEINPFASKI